MYSFQSKFSLDWYMIYTNLQGQVFDLGSEEKIFAAMCVHITCSKLYYSFKRKC